MSINLTSRPCQNEPYLASSSGTQALQHRLFIFIALIVMVSTGMVVISLGRMKAWDLSFIWGLGPILGLLLSPYLGLAVMNKWVAKNRSHFWLLWLASILIGMIGIYIWTLVLFVQPTILSSLIGFGFALYQWIGVVTVGLLIFFHRLYFAFITRKREGN